MNVPQHRYNHKRIKSNHYCFSSTTTGCFIPYMSAEYSCSACTTRAVVPSVVFTIVYLCLRLEGMNDHISIFSFHTAFLHSPYQPVYTATKHGVIGFSRSLAVSKLSLLAPAQHSSKVLCFEWNQLKDINSIALVCCCCCWPSLKVMPKDHKESFITI